MGFKIVFVNRWVIGIHGKSRVMLDLEIPIMCSTVSKCPSLGLALWELRSDVSVTISMRLISTIHRIIPIKDW